MRSSEKVCHHHQLKPTHIAAPLFIGLFCLRHSCCYHFGTLFIIEFKYDRNASGYLCSGCFRYVLSIGLLMPEKYIVLFSRVLVQLRLPASLFRKKIAIIDQQQPNRTPLFNHTNKETSGNRQDYKG